jgi:hypothetical protein
VIAAEYQGLTVGEMTAPGLDCWRDDRVAHPGS